jgi:hypothetical protein
MIVHYPELLWMFETSGKEKKRMAMIGDTDGFIVLFDHSISAKL